ncbi:unnamed protein product [Mytilus coruscus]|uniref:Integrase catalytic domain-containing protein n=1 Tax=Mytilus coruscus TaxID=42192 RepID=A0A6J8BS13_MYTCO|nr:unnamed protein product [Mytilus coruscus]
MGNGFAALQFEIKYRKGCNNQVADALSRRSNPEQPDDENEIAAVKVSEVNTGTEASGKDRTSESIQVEIFYDDYTMVAPLDPVIARPELSNLPAIAKLQQNCPDFGNMYRFLTQGILPADNDQSSKVQKSAQDYSICNNVLYKWFQKRVRVDNGEKWIKQFCLPQALREDALLSYHDSFVGGAHLGIERVYHALSLKYFWPKMHQSIENYIRSCDRCQRIKRDTKGKKPPLNPLPVDTTFERWHMDFLKLSKTNEGYSYVLLLVDSFSKWSEAFPMKTQEALRLQSFLFREIISRYGAMKCLVTDLGRNFVSNLVNALCQMLNITRHHTSSYHPQTNGLVERTNSTLIQAVRAYIPDNTPDAQNNPPVDNDQDDQIADNESTDSETDSDNGDEPNNVIDDTFHEVEKLLNNRNARGIQYFLVKWKNGSKPTWEPKQNIGEGLIQEYFTRKTKKGRRRKQRKYFKRP